MAKSQFKVFTRCEWETNGSRVGRQLDWLSKMRNPGFVCNQTPVSTCRVQCSCHRSVCPHLLPYMSSFPNRFHKPSASHVGMNGLQWSWLKPIVSSQSSEEDLFLSTYHSNAPAATSSNVCCRRQFPTQHLSHRFRCSQNLSQCSPAVFMTEAPAICVSFKVTEILPAQHDAEHD